MARKTTRSANGNGCIRKRSDGRWEGKYTVGTDPGTGKAIRKSVYGKTQEEAAKKLRKAVAAIDEGSYFEPEKITVGKWLDTWVNEYTGDIKPSTLREYKARIKLHLTPNIGAVKLPKLTAPMIQKLYNKLHRGEGTKQPLSARYVRSIHAVLSGALAQAVLINYIKSNPCDKAVQLPRVTKKEIEPLTNDQMVAFLGEIKETHLEPYLLVTLFTGMRQSESMGLTWDCVDFEKGTLLINKQLLRVREKGGQYRFGPPKNDKPRTITPAGTVMALLKEHKRQQIEWRLQAGRAWTNNPELKDLVFTNELGEHYAHSTIYASFKRIAAKLGISDARLHDLRHSYAVAALQAGDDIKTVQDNLGHHTAAFTLDTYAHATNEMKRKSAERMNAFISEIHVNCGQNSGQTIQ